MVKAEKKYKIGVSLIQFMLERELIVIYANDKEGYKLKFTVFENHVIWNNRVKGQ